MPNPSPLPHALSAPEDWRPFAEISLIAFDLDGTLVSSGQASFGKRMRRLMASVSHGKVLMTLATGRTLFGASAVVGQALPLSNVPLVLYNGSVVMTDSGHVVHLNVIETESLQPLLRVVRRSGASALVYCVAPESVLVRDEPVERVYFVGPQTLLPKQEFNGMDVLPEASFDVETENVVAALVKSDGCSTESLKRSLDCIDGISITQSGEEFIEVRPRGSSKASALAQLAERLGISQSEVLAIGDSDNDIELLEWAGTSVSVANSTASARNASKYYSENGPGDACIEVLDTVRLAKRLHQKR